VQVLVTDHLTDLDTQERNGVLWSTLKFQRCSSHHITRRSQQGNRWNYKCNNGIQGHCCNNVILGYFSNNVLQQWSRFKLLQPGWWKPRVSTHGTQGAAPKTAITGVPSPEVAQPPSRPRPWLAVPRVAWEMILRDKTPGASRAGDSASGSKNATERPGL
jgi:hypothetical protein